MISFSSKNASKKLEVEVDEQCENRPPSSDTVIDFIEQSESKPFASTSSAESGFNYLNVKKLEAGYLNIRQ